MGKEMKNATEKTLVSSKTHPQIAFHSPFTHLPSTCHPPAIHP